jgi:hypothetical protein
VWLSKVNDFDAVLSIHYSVLYSKSQGVHLFRSQTEQVSIEDLAMNPCNYGHLIFDKNA